MLHKAISQNFTESTATKNVQSLTLGLAAINILYYKSAHFAVINNSQQLYPMSYGRQGHGYWEGQWSPLGHSYTHIWCSLPPNPVTLTNNQADDTFTSYQKPEIWNESMNQNKWCSSNKTWDSWRDVDKNTLMLRCNVLKRTQMNKEMILGKKMTLRMVPVLRVAISADKN